MQNASIFIFFAARLSFASHPIDHKNINTGSLAKELHLANNVHPSGPQQYKQNQTEEFGSQHVILLAAHDHSNKFRTMSQPTI